MPTTKPPCCLDFYLCSHEIPFLRRKLHVKPISAMARTARRGLKPSAICAGSSACAFAGEDIWSRTCSKLGTAEKVCQAAGQRRTENSAWASSTRTGEFEPYLRETHVLTA